MDAPAGSPTTLDAVAAYAVAADMFAVAIAWTDTRTPVVSCPGWTTWDLAVHLGNVHAWAATIVETGQAAAEQDDQPRARRGKAVSAWYAAKAEDLYQVLRHATPEAPCWNFVDGSAGTTSFWPRRQLHEVTMHQVDLDAARDLHTHIEPAISLDGIDEVLTVMMRRTHARGHPARLDAPVALTASDTGDCWVVAPRSSADGSLPPIVEHRRVVPVGVADRAEAEASVLYRMLWHRPVEPGAVLVDGDEDRVAAFLGSRLTP